MLYPPVFTIRASQRQGKDGEGRSYASNAAFGTAVDFAFR